MNTRLRKRLAACKRRIQRRLDKTKFGGESPMITASNIQYEKAERTRAVSAGGIGLMHQMVKQLELDQALNRQLNLFKIHLPYSESDHVLNIAYNLLAGGECLEDIELWRNDEVYLDALGAQRIPDPTTAGDFCRRFEVYDIQILMRAINAVRTKVWQKQPKAFFERAIIDADGTLVETLGQCKEGMDISYKGQWGYQVLVVSLGNTGEPLFIFNRSGNRPSHEGAAAYYDQAIRLCRQAGFKTIVIRGDTDFTQTGELDRWDGDGVQFIFGIDAMPNLVEIANHLPKTAWKPLDRPVKHRVKTQPRQRPENVKEQIVRQREFENIRLQSEQVAEFDYRPTLCKKSYRVVVVRKNLSVEKGEQVLFDDIRYLFYITNDRTSPADEIVFLANDRCNQEKLIEQLKNGAKALDVPVDNLVSNWAYMVMASLAWTLKAWYALSLPEKGRWKIKHKAEKESVLKMEFKRFLNAFMRVPCQIVRQAGRVVYRLLAWNPWLHVFLRGVDALQQPLQC